MENIAQDARVSQDFAILQEQIAFHEKRAEAVKAQPFRAVIHHKTAEKLRTVLEHILQLQSELYNAANLRRPIRPGTQLSLSPDDLHGLPPELVQELSIDTDRVEFTIINLIDEAGGILSLDKILIGLFKKTGEIHKRKETNNRLYRMEKTNQIFKVPGTKSAYSIRELTPDEVNKIINPKLSETGSQEGAK